MVILSGFTSKLNQIEKVSIANPDLRVRFNLINNVKPGSLYSDGMKPCVRKEKDVSWSRNGENIKYFRNDIL